MAACRFYALPLMIKIPFVDDDDDGASALVGEPAMEASSWLTPSVASMTRSAMSAASRCLRAMTTESFSAMR